MESTAVSPKPPGQSRAQRGPCGVCSHSTSGKLQVPGIGRVGPDCYAKVVALQQVLKREGLANAFGAVVPFTCEFVEGEWRKPVEILLLKVNAERLGLVFRVRRPNSDEPNECWVELPKGAKARKRVLARAEKEAST